jgi:NAD(P)-dependent dehydrogenase (short-subunit alcohol dehydrogenase family)
VLVEAFAAEGAKVVGGDTDGEGGRGTEATVRKAGGEITFVEADVTDEDAVRALVATAVDTYGGLDCAVNNAGTETTGLIAEADAGVATRLLAVNVTGVLLCMKHEIAALRARGGGSIVNMSSVTSDITAVPANGLPFRWGGWPGRRSWLRRCDTCSPTTPATSPARRWSSTAATPPCSPEPACRDPTKQDSPDDEHAPSSARTGTIAPNQARPRERLLRATAQRRRWQAQCILAHSNPGLVTQNEPPASRLSVTPTAGPAPPGAERQGGAGLSTAARGARP